MCRIGFIVQEYFYVCPPIAVCICVCVCVVCVCLCVCMFVCVYVCTSPKSWPALVAQLDAPLTGD